MDETGATIQTKGVWVPDMAKLAPGEVPLYLHIVGKTQKILDAAVAKVNELIDQDLGPLIDQRALIARNRAMGLPPPPGMEPPGRARWPEAKLPIGLDTLRNFNVRAKTVGPGVSFAQRSHEVFANARACSSSTSRPRPDAVYRSRVWARDSWSRTLDGNQTSQCTSTLREC